MKRLIVILIVSILSVHVHAQLTHTAWKGTIKGDNPQSAVFKFAKDTVVLYGADGSVLETMIYSVKGNAFTVTKIAGQSDCDGSTPGKYSFAIKDGLMDMNLAADNCGDRSSALDKTQWTKTKY